MSIGSKILELHTAWHTIGNEEGVFEINDISGVLRTVAPLDREERDQYILSIQAMDSAGVNSLSSITEVRTRNKLVHCVFIICAWTHDS